MIVGIPDTGPLVGPCLLRRVLDARSDRLPVSCRVGISVRTTHSPCREKPIGALLRSGGLVGLGTQSATNPRMVHIIGVSMCPPQRDQVRGYESAPVEQRMRSLR